MHPQITSPQPGECPICHMMLEPIVANRSDARTDPKPATSTPPPTRQPQTGADGSAKAPPQANGSAMAPPGTTPPGTTPIKLALDRVQAIDVRTTLVEE